MFKANKFLKYGHVRLFLNLPFVLSFIFCFTLKSNIGLAHSIGDDLPLPPDGIIEGTPVHQYITWQSLDAYVDAPQELKDHIKAKNLIDLKGVSISLHQAEHIGASLSILPYCEVSVHR